MNEAAQCRRLIGGNSGQQANFPEQIPMGELAYSVYVEQVHANSLDLDARDLGNQVLQIIGKVIELQVSAQSCGYSGLRVEIFA
jgi:hypothetical protein